MTEASPKDSDYIEKKSKLMRVLVAAEWGISFALLTGLIFLVVLQVFTRFVLNNPLVWTEELARFVFIWFVFISAAYVTARRKNITVLLFGSKLIGAKGVAVVEVFAHTLVIVVSGILVLGGVQLMDRTSALIWPGTGIPVSFVYGVPVAAFILLILHSAFNLYLSARYWEQFIDATEDITKMGV